MRPSKRRLIGSKLLKRKGLQGKKLKERLEKKLKEKLVKRLKLLENDIFAIPYKNCGIELFLAISFKAI